MRTEGRLKTYGCSTTDDEAVLGRGSLDLWPVAALSLSTNCVPLLAPLALVRSCAYVCRATRPVRSSAAARGAGT